MSDVQSLAEDLVETFDGHLELDADTVVTKLNEKIEKYKLPADEAHELVQRKYAKEAGVTVEDISNETVSLDALSIDGQEVNVEVKIVEEFDTSHDSMVQAGLVGDESGTKRFTVWSGDQGDPDPLDVGKSYKLSSVLIDEYNGQYSIKITPLSSRTELESDVKVGDDTTTYDGVITKVSEERSGYITRCPHEDCTRVLDGSACPEHGQIDDGVDDIRIIGYLLTGTITHQVVFNTELTERLTGMSVSDATELKKENIGAGNIVGREFRDEVLGDEISVEGFSYGDSDMFVVTGMNELNPPSADGTVERIKKLSNNGETA